MHKKIISALATAALCLAWGESATAWENAPSKLDTIIVTATKTEHLLQDVPAETVLISRKEIEKSGAKTVAALLNMVPGFNFSQQADLTGAMGYKNTFRGLNVESRRMLILVDGQRVFGGYHTGGMAGGGDALNLNVVPVNLIERIEVVKGPASAIYGSDAVSGVINIITKTPSRKFLSTAGANYGWYRVDGEYYGAEAMEKERQMYNAYATLAGPLGNKLSGTISFSRETHDGLKETKYDVYKNYLHTQLQLEATDSFTLRGGAEFTDYEADGKTTILGGQDDDTMDEQAPRFWLIGDYIFTPEHRLRVQGYIQQLEGNILDPVNGGTQEYKNSYKDVEAQYTGQFLDTHLVTAGAEYLETSYEGNWVEDGSNATLSLYAQDEWSLLDDMLLLVSGLRFDDNNDWGQEWSPKFNVMYTPFPETKIRGSLGWTFKAPTVRELTGVRFWMGNMWAEGNPDLVPESGFTWQAGVEQGLYDQRIIVGVTYYNTRLDDMLDTEISVLEDGSWLMKYMNRNDTEIQGVEASVNVQIMEPLTLLFTYTYTDARDANTDERLINVPEHAFNARLDYTNREHGFGGMVSLSHTTDQKNPYGPPDYTRAFSSVNLKLWKEILGNGRISVEASNLFDEELRDAMIIYPRQMIMASLQFNF